KRLSVPLRMRHPEVSMNVLLGVAALLVPDQNDRDVLDLRQLREDAGIIPVSAVAVELEETGRDHLQVVERVGPPRMPRKLHPLPARQLGVDIAAEPLDLPLEAFELLRGLRLLRRCGGAEVLDAALQIHDRLFEIEPGSVHRVLSPS